MKIFDSFVESFAESSLEIWGLKKCPRLAGTCVIAWGALHMLISFSEVMLALFFLSDAPRVVYESAAITALVFFFLGVFFIRVGKLMCRHK
ncbi:MAG: hypothetical protein Q7S52_05280 [bacterium]|nr:hypothetical protein [bacterium]